MLPYFLLFLGSFYYNILLAGLSTFFAIETNIFKQKTKRRLKQEKGVEVDAKKYRVKDHSWRGDLLLVVVEN